MGSTHVNAVSKQKIHKAAADFKQKPVCECVFVWEAEWENLRMGEWRNGKEEWKVRERSCFDGTLCLCSFFRFTSVC